jgi:hypothetical protein
LDEALHAGPSGISIDSFLSFKDDLPENFLRGGGLSDEVIEAFRGLVGRAIRFYSCFISYSGKDEEFAKRLHADLQSSNVRCWFAPEDIKGGEKLHEQINQAIRRYERLLLILSESSMSSEWVKTEIANAREREVREKKRVLFPIRLVDFETIRNWECFDADMGKDSAREIREYFIPDFSNWKDRDSYKAALDRLLRDMRADPEPAP